MGSLQCEEAVIHLTVARKDVPSKVSGWRGMRLELLSQSVGRNARHPLSTSSRIPTITSSLTVAEFVCKLSGCRLSCHIRPSAIQQMADSQKRSKTSGFSLFLW